MRGRRREYTEAGMNGDGKGHDWAGEHTQYNIQIMCYRIVHLQPM